ncbi:virulence factor [Pleurocapsales cyanobacterium LEGE 06147]|nr:virulence factor [Pleurocapsales cyanobacterium LEGE 06147]
MKLSSLETTPNPNCMKLNLDKQVVEKPLSLQRGQQLARVPDKVKQLLEIEGVREAFLASNFITLTRHGNADWQPILSQAARLLGVADNAASDLTSHSLAGDKTSEATTSKSLGEVEIAVLVFRGIPSQVRVLGASEQARVNLGDRFEQVLQRVLQATGANYVQERHWEPYSPRHGNPKEIAKMVADEVASLIDDEELARLEQAALAGSQSPVPTSEKASQEDLLALLESSDWKVRLKAIQKLKINTGTFPTLVKALDDSQAAIRRWAAALLGASEMPEAVKPLSRVVLNDSSSVVRRTAGDALSDLGNEQAIPTMCRALQDRSKLVRWRAARFLNEMGDKTALAALQIAGERESEFDVRLEIEAAVERITGGGERQLPMWMRLSQNKN